GAGCASRAGARWRPVPDNLRPEPEEREPQPKMRTAWPESGSRRTSHVILDGRLAAAGCLLLVARFYGPSGRVDGEPRVHCIDARSVALINPLSRSDFGPVLPSGLTT